MILMWMINFFNPICSKNYKYIWWITALRALDPNNSTVSIYEMLTHKKFLRDKALDLVSKKD